MRLLLSQNHYRVHNKYPLSPPSPPSSCSSKKANRIYRRRHFSSMSVLTAIVGGQGKNENRFTPVQSSFFSPVKKGLILVHTYTQNTVLLQCVDKKEKGRRSYELYRTHIRRFSDKTQPAGRSEGRQSFTVGMRRGDNSIQKAKGRKEGPRKKEDRFVPIKEKNKYAQYNKRKSRPW